MSSFAIGSKVILQNLSKGSQYNGTCGVVKSSCVNNGRRNVLLCCGGVNKTVAVKPENMKLVEHKVMGAPKSENSSVSDVPPPNSISCANCGNTDGELSQCTCKACKKLKGIESDPVYYCNNNGVCQKSNEQEHISQQSSLLSSFTSMVLDDMKKKWDEKDPCRMFEDDEALFADPPPRDECPICCLPLQLDNSQIFYQACCGKLICHGCIHVVNDQTDDGACPFCRTPACEDITPRKVIMGRLKRRMDADDGDAYRTLGNLHSRGWCGFEQDMKKAIECWSKGAQLGSIDSHYELGDAYYEGVNGVKQDVEKGKYHFQVAAVGGHIAARRMLGYIELKHDTMTEEAYQNGAYLARASKHWSIAARAGCKESMGNITKGYSSYLKNCLTKSEFEATLRAHKNATDAMRSEQRDKAAEFDHVQERLRRIQKRGH